MLQVILVWQEYSCFFDKILLVNGSYYREQVENQPLSPKKRGDMLNEIEKYE